MQLSPAIKALGSRPVSSAASVPWCAFFFFFFLCLFLAQGKSYYVSFEAGNDNSDGSTPALAFKTIAAAFNYSFYGPDSALNLSIQILLLPGFHPSPGTRCFSIGTLVLATIEMD